MSTFSTRPSSICIFCYKTNGNFRRWEMDKDTKSGTVVVVNRFLTLLSRFTNSGSSSVARCLSDFHELSRWTDCCEECVLIVDQFCSAYHEMELLELELNWKLERLSKSMELAGRIPSRWAKLKKVVQRSNGFQAGAVGESSWTDEKGQDRLLAVRNFRQDIIQKCSARLAKSKPIVMITEKVKVPSTPKTQNGNKNGNRGAIQLHVANPSGQLNPQSFPNSPLTQPDTTVKETATTVTVATVMKVEVPEGDTEKATSSPTPNFEEDESPLILKLKIEETNDAESEKDPTFHPPDDDDNISSASDNDDSIPVKLEKPLKRKLDPSSRNIKCSICDERFRRKDNLVHHMGSVHNQGTPIPCKICGKSFFTQERLDKHKWAVHSGHVFRCQKCDKTYKTMGALTQHVLRAHKNARFECSECGKILKSRWGYKQHAFLHTGKTTANFWCSMCGYTCRQKNSLEIHILRKHKNKSTREVTCKICGNKFSNSTNLSAHINSEHIDKGVGECEIFQCSQCDKKFVQELTLKKHYEWVHGDGKSHKCKECGKSFGTVKYLKRHAVIHADPSTWRLECSECGKKCYDKKNLDRHMVSQHKDKSLV